jgi:hypothetical protein
VSHPLGVSVVVVVVAVVVVMVAARAGAWVGGRVGWRSVVRAWELVSFPCSVPLDGDAVDP